MFARGWKKNEIGEGSKPAWLLRAGGAGGHRAEWLHAAIRELREQEGVERAGVWLEEQTYGDSREANALELQGEVWDKGIGSGPSEWKRLSVEALPVGLLSRGMPCEYRIGDCAPAFGAFADLGRLLLLPVHSGRLLRGLVMLGRQNSRRELPRGGAERVAGELGLLLELEAARRLAASRKADLELWRRVQGLLAEGQAANMVLSQLAESCTRGASCGGAGAVFALIGERKASLPVGMPSEAGEEEQVEIRAQSGEASWSQSVSHGPLEPVWRLAVENRRVVGVEANRFSAAKEISRIVGIPLEEGQQTLGVLLAGLPRPAASLEALDRLELRAVLAADVLAKERQYSARREQEQWYNALLETSLQAVVVVNGEGFVTGMSAGARALLEFDQGLEKGTTRFAEFFRPGQWARIHEWRNRIDHAQETLESELHQGKAVRLQRLSLSPKGSWAVRLDEVEEPERSKTIDEMEEQLRQSLEWLEEGVVIFDQHEQILARNMRFLQILGFSEQEGRRMRTLDDAIHLVQGNAAEPERFAAQWRALAENFADGTREELAFDRPLPQLIERCARPIIGAKGKRLGRVEVYRELTARRMFESKMLKAEKLASLGQRVTGVVHELSNPLTAILGNAQRLILRDEAGGRSEEAHRILEESTRATALLRQLLFVSRETRLERRLVSLNEVVQRAADLQRASLAGSELQLKLEVPERLPLVEGDSGQLQQVLLNLLQNAQQAIEESAKGNTIGVRACRVTPRRVRLEVWDDGPGIPESLRARIFDPFFTTKPPDKGTGLGLAIVSGIVRQHGGTVALECPAAGGARFLVELPAAGEFEAADTVAADTGSFSTSAAPPVVHSGANCGAWEAITGATRVLVVEDEPTVGILIADVLREDGFRVDVLPDAEKGLEAAGRLTYDLAICDMRMPGMDGALFYKALVEAKNPLSEHILFMTGDVVAQRTQEFLERHRLPHLAKPFRVEELCLAFGECWKSAPTNTPQRVVTAPKVLGTGRDMSMDGLRENETRDFGEVLRHELNNPLTGILGNAELLLVELRRRRVELPPDAKLRLETIAALAVRMRETVRWLSEQWEAQSLGFSQTQPQHPEAYR